MSATARQRWFVHLSAVLLGAVLWTAVTTVGADETASVAASPPAVLLIRPSDSSACTWPAAENRLLEELSLLNISVETRDVDVDISNELRRDEMLQQSAQNSGARIAVIMPLLPGAPLRVEIRLYDRNEDITAVKTWPLFEPDTLDAAIIAGIRGAEAIRAALRTSPDTIEPASALPPTTAAVSNDASSPASTTVGRSSASVENANSSGSLIRRFGLGGGACMATSFEESGVQGGVLLTLDWRPLRLVGMVFDAIYLPWGEEISSGGITSAVDMVLFRVQAVWLVSDRGKLRPALGLGGGSLLVFAEGVSGDGRPLTKDLTKVGYLGGTAALGLIAVEWLRIELVAGLGVSLHAVTLHHGETAAARIGRPLLDVSLRVGFGVF